MNIHPTTIPSRQDYAEAFRLESAKDYPEMDRLEQSVGYAVGRERLEAAAQILACPVKANPPNWQHGRMLYAYTRRYLANTTGRVCLLDIGTAKGFSALMLKWALVDSGLEGSVDSVDVIDPLAKVYRNSVLDTDCESRLADYHLAWPEASEIQFHKMTGVRWLEQSSDRVHVAFVDGKHSGDVVVEEGRLLASRQQPWDLAIFDDVQLPGIADAVYRLRSLYDMTHIELKAANRKYAVGVRR
jgi:hypothetical protein